MKKISVLIVVALLVLGTLGTIAQASAEKVDVCHRVGNGSFILINISQNALAAHVAHGDGQPGDPVPDMPGKMFDEACNVVEPIRVSSGPMNFSGTGWGGWSCPAGYTVVGGGYEPAEHYVLVSQPAKPGVGTYPFYPHYNYKPPEEGWVVQNGGTPATLEVYALCLPN
jgi:hypothetical protein